MDSLRRVALVMLLAGCTHGSPLPPERRSAGSPRVTLAPGGGPEISVEVEIARTPSEQQRGLMFRDHLDQGHGMVFLFDTPHHLEFWMHNTYIPLDMIFIGVDRKVTGVVQRAQPMTDDPRGVDAISQFVLEVPAGFAAEHRIGAGTPIRFIDIEPSR